MIRRSRPLGGITVHIIQPPCIGQVAAGAGRRYGPVVKADVAKNITSINGRFQDALAEVSDNVRFQPAGCSGRDAEFFIGDIRPAGKI